MCGILGRLSIILVALEAFGSIGERFGNILAAFSEHFGSIGKSHMVSKYVSKYVSK